MASNDDGIPVDFTWEENQTLADLGFLDEESQAAPFSAAPSATFPSTPPQQPASMSPAPHQHPWQPTSTSPAPHQFFWQPASLSPAFRDHPRQSPWQPASMSLAPWQSPRQPPFTSPAPWQSPQQPASMSPAFHVSSPFTRPQNSEPRAQNLCRPAFRSSYSPTHTRSPGFVSHALENLFANLLLTKVREEKGPTMLKIFSDHGNELVALAQTSVGIHAVLRLIHDSKESIRRSKCLTAALEYNVLNLMKNPIGHNVVVACLSNLCYESNLCFIQAGVSNFDELAFHETGCSTLQLVIEKAEGQFRDILFEKIASSFIGLAMNRAGNFLVQHALRLNEPGFNTVICETLVEHLRDLSLDPYGHYVVKEFLIVSSRETAHRVVQAIIMLDRHTVKKIWGDRHGKYVMGAAMTVPMETDLMRQLLSALD